jgi:hypothetical protein
MRAIFRLSLAFAFQVACLQFIALPAPVAAAATPAPRIQYFSTEATAQAHCPRDTVVWLNTKTGIYHLKGERWYGNTKQGAYVCKAEADATPGDRETRNGQ